MHLSARLQRRSGRFRPYAEGLIGFKYLLFKHLLIRTRIGDGDFGDGPGGDLGGEIASSTNYNGFALSGGAGIDVRVFRQEKAAKTVQAVRLRLGAQ